MSSRARIIAKLYAEGVPPKQIAHEMGITVPTVDYHIKRFMVENNIPDRMQLIHHALSTGVAQNIHTSPKVEFKTLAYVEREHILSTLAACGGVKRRAFKILGISERGLRNKLRSYGIFANT